LSDYARLLRRGQLYIGEHIPERFSTWTRVSLDDSLWLAAHPGLNVARAVRGSFVLTAIGFLIDPEHPERSDAEIVADLLATPGFTASPFEPTYRLGGRWLLVLAGPEDTVAFGDAGGLRQIYLAPSGDGGKFHFASEPGLLGELGGLDPDPEADAFRRSPGFMKNSENWWPGDASPFREVRRLLPNHAVSLRTGHRTRFWPSARGARTDAEEAVRLLVRRLPAMLKGFASRGGVEISLTAGLDSRLVLSGTREMAGALRYLTVRQAGMPADHADLEIARRLADRLGLEHRVLVSAESVREPVRAAFRDGILTYHEKWLQDAQAIFDAGGQDVGVVTGSMGEALRLVYRRSGVHSRRRVSAKTLARIAKLGTHPFALRHFEAWLDSLDRSRIGNVGDIYYLEQRSARWLASSQLEFGQVWGEVFAPLSSREIIATLQAAPQRARREPKSLLFREVIRRLWPEALLEPINPHLAAKPTFRLPRFARRLQGRVRRLLG
jgi:hypothetical protein